MNIPLHETSTFKERVHKDLNNHQLRKNLRGAMDFLVERRRLQFTDDDELTQLRDQGQQIRQNALSKLPDLLEQLEQQCTENGIQVHWAETTGQANQIVLDIAQKHQAKKIIKGKSMVSEEMELNHFLEQQGIEALESDMGEYIVQLDHEKPSHIIMPAIHKSAAEIAELFTRKIPGLSYTEDVNELIGTGRKILRKKFFEADIGISGVNFAVAETGTLCLVENEGNGRMTTTVPPVHIAVTGIEKVVEKLSDIPPLLTLLTRSATGQPISTYFNMITSPRKPGELDGPDEVHLVLLDNGRSQAYADEQMRQTLQCIRCGACMNHCPVYSRVGGQAYGTTYPGPIGKIISPHLLGLEQTSDLPSASSLCGACGEVCPVRIPIPELLQRLRKEKVHIPEKETQPVIQGQGTGFRAVEASIWRFWAWLNRSPGIYRLVLFFITRFRKLTPRNLGPWSKNHASIMPARKSLHELMSANSSKPKIKL